MVFIYHFKSKEIVQKQFNGFSHPSNFQKIIKKDIEYINKIFYKVQEAVIKLFDDCSKIASEVNMQHYMEKY